MQDSFRRLLIASLLAVTLLANFAKAADFAVLTPETWAEYTPQGKEADAIYGDFVLRNEHIVAVIAQPIATRNANMTVRSVGGCLIDFTERKAQNDQLSCYYPGGAKFQFHVADQVRIEVGGKELPKDAKIATGKVLVVEIAAQPVPEKSADGKPLPATRRLNMRVRYTLADDSDHLQIETVFSNSANQPVEEDLADAIRADKTFTFGTDAATSLFWADDEWFRQAYGVVIPGYEVKPGGARGTTLALHAGGSNRLKLGPREAKNIVRKLFPFSNLLWVRGNASVLAGEKFGLASIKVVDPSPVPHAKILILRDGKDFASGRTDAAGNLVFPLARGEYAMTVTSIDGRTVSGKFTVGEEYRATVTLPPPSYVVGTITNSAGQPIPAKVSFHAPKKAASKPSDAKADKEKDDSGPKDPDWGPESGEVAIKNVYYTHNGQLRQVIAPGHYDVIVSYGPEHDAVFTSVDVPAGGEGKFQAVLKRSVDTRGWVSADFHSHSTPSGDNTSSQLGRVLNLLCEHVEFAPCTEHNRVDTYAGHLKKLGIEHLLATCTGIELTGSPLPINHQNAFPILHKPHTQDGGGPVTDLNPVIQIERLALWDNKSDKLVQMNHPNLPQILGDRDLDGKPDAGFEKMFGFVDVIEVHPPQGIFDPPTRSAGGKLENNPIFHWVQMLNLGYRLAGVVNTDSHYNYHESGFLRNFLESSTDDPAKIDTMEMVHAAEHGHVIVSNGPFLSVKLHQKKEGKTSSFAPGDAVKLSGEPCELEIGVQCPNWFDVNRVQVFLNGRPSPELNFTRRTTPDRFTNDTMRFHARLPLALKSDTHVIVGTLGEGLTMGPVMGPTHGKVAPCAVSNPIFVDVDGGGFTPNKDLLDVPLPFDPTKPLSLHRHDHSHD